MDSNLKTKVNESVSFLRKKTTLIPEILIIAGSGFSDSLSCIEAEATIPYDEIPHFRQTSVQSHSGKLIMGHIGKVPVMGLAGRYHAYEGYSMEEITHGVRVASKLGAKTMIVSNLSGGIHQSYQLGDFVLVADHINLSGTTPLAGNFYDDQQERFVDMTDAYSPRLRELMLKTAKGLNLGMKEGVLAYLIGPTFETRAELKFLEMVGSDLIGWSMVPEVTVARAEGLETIGICCVSDLVHPSLVKKADVTEIFSVGAEKANLFKQLLTGFIQNLEKQ